MNWKRDMDSGGKSGDEILEQNELTEWNLHQTTKKDQEKRGNSNYRA